MIIYYMLRCNDTWWNLVRYRPNKYEAIRKVNQAIIESGTDERVIALKQVEALKEMANNPANKLILPNETLSSLGSIAAIGEMLKGEK